VSGVDLPGAVRVRGSPAPGVCNDRRPAPGPTLGVVYSDDTPDFDRLLAETITGILEANSRQGR